MMKSSLPTALLTSAEQHSLGYHCLWMQTVVNASAEASEALNPLLLIKTVGLHDWLRLSCKGSRKSGFLNARVVFGI